MTTSHANIVPFYSQGEGAARLPAVYEQAKAALAGCYQIDECRSWADKAEALASYARQAEDKTLLNDTMRIQGRAIRRCGELLKQIAPDKGGYHGNDAQEGARQSTRTKAAQDAGLSEWQRKTGIRVANIIDTP